STENIRHMEDQNASTGEFVRDKTTEDFVKGLKEREDLKAQLAEKEKEVNNLKGQNYDLMVKLESLQKQENKKPGSRPMTGRKPKRPAKRKNKPETKDRKKSSVEASDNKEVVDPFDDPEKLYSDIAVRFPELPLSTVLSAEKRFVDADINRDGTIDDSELERLLDRCSASEGTELFTKDQVQEIMRKIDVDKTNSIDFLECLA
ncbi:hypothetical protein QZH41_017390, partial [Actinostola sp. cb2023]